MLNKFNIESIGRKAVDIIKSKWGLPASGFLAGGSIANVAWELISGNVAKINDIDIFVFCGILDKTPDEDLFCYEDQDIRYYEDYCGLNWSTYTKDFYSIIESKKDGIFNIIEYKSNISDPSIVIKSFDINATRIGYSIDEDKLYWTKEFEEFLKTGELKISNIMTPSHTAIRIVKKSKELNVKLDIFEIKLLQYALTYKFKDMIKLRFMERYYDIYKEYSEFLNEYFIILRDPQIESYVKNKHDKDVELYFLKSIESVTENIDHFFRLGSNTFEDENIDNIYMSNDFLFYMRNVYGNKELKNIWNKMFYFFDDNSYVDININIDDLELLHRFFKYAPNSIEKLRGLKLSEQIEIIKKFLDKFKDDPIIAISILENIKIDKDIELNDQNTLLLELSVRKKIVNDTKGKVNKILNLTPIITG